ncbi:hypothetical protein DIURU_005048 [Diutina rugosa]|uniref:Protein CFT1 n=1 Tax=Diutina rugosa TaxID=5481 RepID=A0A642UFV7_DIURU|nr:uncharacterized protein DIURU_005048 [Diutina rugosa]KAA8898193.1 hypothetical protein DIURU_005048 [Diutina rugosa]
MEAYTEIIEPSRVSHCLGLHFISPNVEHLMVAKDTLLQLFELVPTSDGLPKLMLVDQYKLHGCVTDLKRIKTVESELDYLIVSTKFAKYSVVKWDATAHQISTVSLHYYEQAMQKLSMETLSRSDLTVEPTHSSVACLRFKNLMAFLPFIVETDDDDDMFDDDKPLAVNSSAQQEVFDPSFIIDANTLDSSLGDLIDLQFLYNYSEPTIAFLSQKQYTWAGMLPRIKDNVTYTVLTLDTTSKSTVQVLKIDNLPYDIDRIVPLPSPMNGSLLIGCNELIHVDNGGIVRRIAVNEFTSSCTVSMKNYTDQSLLKLRLEYCSVAPVPNESRVLLISRDGDSFYINFELDGKAIKKMTLERVSDSSDDSALKVSQPGEIASIGKEMLFIASAGGDSRLVKFQPKGSVKTEGANEAEISNEKMKKIDDEDGIYDDDEDLYGDDDAPQAQNRGLTALEWTLADTLANLGPMSSFTLGFSSTEKHKCNLPNPQFKEIAVVAASGIGPNTSLSVMTPSLPMSIKSSLTFSQVNRMWTINQQFLITSDDVNQKSEIFQIDKKYARLKTRDFKNDESTIAIHELDGGKYILQVSPRSIALYTDKFKRTLDLTSEIGESECVTSYIRDEYLMVFLASGVVKILSINTYNSTYTTIDIPEILGSTIITSGYITNSHLLNVVSKDEGILKRGTKRAASGASKSENIDFGRKQKTFILITADNRIVAFTRQHNNKCYQLNDTSRMSEHLSLAKFDPKDQEPDPNIKQVIFNDLGDRWHSQEYLTILTVGGEVILYKLYFDGSNFRFVKESDLKMTGAPSNAYPEGTAVERRLVYFADINSYTAILVTGIIPFFILKSIHSPPRIFRFTNMAVASAAPYTDHRISNGLVWLDLRQNARICQLPIDDMVYDFEWPVRRIPIIGESINAIDYHETSQCYVVSTVKSIPYNAIDEELNPIVGTDPEKESSKSYLGSIKLISPMNWSVIDQIALEPNEVCMSLKSMVVDVGSSSTKFKSKKEVVVFGTGKYRMEDLASNGSFYVYEIVAIVPEPGRPETNHKFKQMYQESTKGAVTMVGDVSGRFLVAQGQKIIVRDVMDSGVVSVAFIDLPTYVSEAKSFGNLIAFGDSLKSVWLVAFDAEPFRMVMLGKDLRPLDVTCADFVCHEDDVHIVVADNNNVLSVLQYDPDDPASANGSVLLTRANFAVNSYVSGLRSMPNQIATFDSEANEIRYRLSGNWKTIGSCGNGSLFAMTPLSEDSYRRLYLLQQQMTDKEYHTCGLNPRLNRLHSRDGAADVNQKPVIDGEVIRYFKRLTNDRRDVIATRVSTVGNPQEVWRDLINLEQVVNIL